MTYPSDTNFPSRSLAAKAAKKAGHVAFQCRQFGKGESSYWQYETVRESPGLTYAYLIATGLDYVSHVEAPNVLVVTCHPDEVDDEIRVDELLDIQPLTPSMLDADTTRRKRTAREHVEARANPVATITYLPGYDTPLVNPITGLPIL